MLQTVHVCTGGKQFCEDCESMLGLQEKLKRMNPEQRAKAEARQERIQSKRAMKQRMIRA